MSQQAFRFRPQLEAFEDRLCPSATVVLPISAFLAQQGHDITFAPPMPDTQGWSNSMFDPGATAADPNRTFLVDYAGLAAGYLRQHGINLHTNITGYVTETPLGTTGLMEVSLNLEATNALTWVANTAGLNVNMPGVINTAPLEVGYKVQELVANPQLTPALSNLHFQVTWQEDVGANLPDLARLNENYALYAPPGFAYERFDFQSWGTGTLRAGTTQGTPGQTAIVSTWQVADLTNSNLPGTLPDGFWQEPIDLIPITSPAAHVGYLNGTLFVTDLGNGNDHVTVSPAAHGGVTLSGNLGSGTYAPVTRVVTALGSGNNNVTIGNLPGTTVDVTALDGNNNLSVGGGGKVVVSAGSGNNNITTGNTTPGAQFVGVIASGNNNINVNSPNAAEVLVFGNGNNNVSARGASDFIEVLGEGNNNITDTGTHDLVWLGGAGNNNINNRGVGSFTDYLALEQPFSESLTVVSVLGTGETHFTGYSPQLGHLTAVLNPNGTFIDTTSNGDEVFGYSTPATATTGSITNTGGTGQFRGLTGQATYIVSTDSTTGATTVTVTGFIEYPQRGSTQVTAFNINGGGPAPDGLPVFVGGTAPHTATGTGTDLGNYTGAGTFELLSLDPATLTGTFQGTFVFVASNGDRLATTYGAGAGNPGTFTLTPTASGLVVATFVAEFTPVAALSTGRFAQVTGGGFLMVATSAPFALVPNAQGYTPAFTYTWVGQGLLDFSNG